MILFHYQLYHKGKIFKIFLWRKHYWKKFAILFIATYRIQKIIMQQTIQTKFLMKCSQTYHFIFSRKKAGIAVWTFVNNGFIIKIDYLSCHFFPQVSKNITCWMQFMLIREHIANRLSSQISLIKTTFMIIYNFDNRRIFQIMIQFLIQYIFDNVKTQNITSLSTI